MYIVLTNNFRSPRRERDVLRAKGRPRSAREHPGETNIVADAESRGDAKPAAPAAHIRGTEACLFAAVCQQRDTQPQDRARRSWTRDPQCWTQPFNTPNRHQLLHQPHHCPPARKASRGIATAKAQTSNSGNKHLLY